MESQKLNINNRLTRSIKKESLLLKKKRVQVSKKIEKTIGYLVNANYYSAEELQGVFLYLSEKQLLTNGYFDNPKNGKKLIVDLNTLPEVAENYLCDTVLLLPVEWLEKGGCSLSFSDLIHNFNEVSYIYNDDFYLVNEQLNSSVSIIGDRISDSSSVSINVNFVGNYFSGFVKQLINKS